MDSSFSSSIESLYQQRTDAMTPAERVARAAAMFQWTREQIARQVIAEQGEMDEVKLNWMVGLRLYGGHPVIRRWIERKLEQITVDRGF